MPEEATAEWAFAIPECSPLNKSDKARMKKCSAFSNHEVCETGLRAELSNAMTNDKKVFNLNYHVFASKEKCQADRNSAMAGE